MEVFGWQENNIGLGDSKPLYRIVWMYPLPWEQLFAPKVKGTMKEYK
jgi:hypothetical protein